VTTTMSVVIATTFCGILAFVFVDMRGKGSSGASKSTNDPAAFLYAILPIEFTSKPIQCFAFFN
jgi:hypothetical protein